MTTAAEPQRRRRRRPLSSHPLFPFAVASWFAALLGLCTLALPPSLLQAGVAASGIDQVFPAAAPPLGETARLLIVLAMSTLGEIAGLLVARAIRRGAQPKLPVEPVSEEPPVRRARDRHPDAPPRRPISAETELAVTAPPAIEMATEVLTDEGGSREPHAPAIPQSLLQLTDRLGHEVHGAANTGRIPIALAGELRACRDALDEAHRLGEPPPGLPAGEDMALKDALASLQRIAGAR